jgi:hypothetical protein
MEINRRLYFLHIPKTGGRSIDGCIGETLDSLGIPRYYRDGLRVEGQIDFNDYVYIQRHIGTYPIGKTKNLDVAVILRDPIDRSISNFLFIHDGYLKNNPQYENCDSLVERLKYYLFEDSEHTSQNNIQSRFICNTMSDDLFNHLFFGKQTSLEYTRKTNCGYIEDSNTEIEFAKQQLDSFSIVGTNDCHSFFLEQICNWFEKNYNININRQKYSRINNSSLYFNAVKYDTKLLRSLLTKQELNRIEKNNAVDCELYEYAKNINLSQ